MTKPKPQTRRDMNIDLIKLFRELGATKIIVEGEKISAEFGEASVLQPPFRVPPLPVYPPPLYPAKPEPIPPGVYTYACPMPSAGYTLPATDIKVTDGRETP